MTKIPPITQDLGEEAMKQYEVPDDIQKILNTNYVIPDLSDDERENDDDISLQMVQRPIMQRKLEETQPTDELINNTTIEDHLKNMLSQLGLVRTLNQFQSEYLEISPNQLQNLNSTSSQLLQENLDLKFQLKQTQLENDKISQAATKAKDQYTKLRQQRDFHRTKHRQVVQEKSVLINDLRRLREHCQLYQPLIMELNARYDKLLRQKQLSDISKDRAQNELKKLQMATESAEKAPITKIQQPLPAIQVQHFKQTYQNPLLEENDLFNSKIKLIVSNPSKIHEGPVSCLAFHRNLAVTSTCSSDGSFKVLTNFNSTQNAGQLMIRAQPHSSFITGAKFCNSGQFQSIIASCAGDGTTKLFNIADQTDLCTLKSISGVQNLGLDWNSETVLAVAASDKCVRLYDIQLNQLMQQIKIEEQVSFMSLRGATRACTQCTWQPYSNLLGVGCSDGIGRVYDVRGNILVSSLKMSSSCKVAFDFSQQQVACADMDGNVVVQDVRTCKQIQKFVCDQGIQCLSYDNQQSLMLGTKKGLFWSGNGKSLQLVNKTELFGCESIDFMQIGTGGFGVGCSDGQVFYVV